MCHSVANAWRKKYFGDRHYIFGCSFLLISSWHIATGKRKLTPEAGLKWAEDSFYPEGYTGFLPRNLHAGWCSWQFTSVKKNITAWHNFVVIRSCVAVAYCFKSVRFGKPWIWCRLVPLPWKGIYIITHGFRVCHARYRIQPTISKTTFANQTLQNSFLQHWN